MVTLEAIDEACSRLVQRPHTSEITRQDIEKFGIRLREKLRPIVQVCGGVFSNDSDDLWQLSGGYDVGKDGEINESAQKIINEEFDEFLNKCVPKDPRFKSVPADWDVTQMTVVAMQLIACDELIGQYHGYYTKSGEPSNEKYNASVGGTGGEITVDPCWGAEEPMVEWINSVTHRINEPPPNRMQNCKWRIKRSKTCEIFAAREIKAGEELFLFYGEGHAPLRDYEIACDSVWQETEDSYLSE